VTEPSFTLRPYAAADEAAAIELWRTTWQQAYPAIDFTARVDWWRSRWRHELVPNASIVVVQIGGELIGFVTVERATGYLDQIVVDLQVNQDNSRAVRFYKKHGFAISGEDVNPRSGAPVYRMRWRA